MTTPASIKGERSCCNLARRMGGSKCPICMVDLPAQHTPGPWIVTPKHSNRAFASMPNYKTNVGAGDYGSICSTRACRPDPRENEANARLIAAAPEMRAYLEATAAALEQWIMGNASALDGRLHAIRALLARIDGQKG